MNLNGSSGERYSINKKRRYTGSTYTDYQIVGSGGYVARIFNRSQRKPGVEQELLDAARSGAYYGEERPLNVLYSHNNFVGFLYEGEVAAGFGRPETAGDERETDSGYYNTASRSNQNVFLYAVQIAAMIIAIAIGYFAVYPMYLSNVNKNWNELSSLLQTMAGWNVNGIPAIIVGIVFQVFALRKLKDGVDSCFILGGIGLLANIAGIIAFTLLFSLILYIVQGAITFIMRYLVIIILIVVGILWLKKKLFGDR